MNYELNQFSDWVTHSHLPDWQTINTEILRIQREMMVSSFQADPATLQRYIIYHQTEITRIADLLCDSIMDNEGPDVNTVYDNPKVKQIEALEILLEFLTTHFGRYLDWDIEISRCLYYRFQHAVKTFRNNQITLLSDVDNYFSQIYHRIYEPIINGETLPLHKLKFLKDVYQQTSLTINYNKVISNRQLIDLFIKVNYNDPQFIEYIKSFINESVYQRDTLEHQLQELERFKNEMMNISSADDLVIGVKEVIIKWITNEIEEKRHEVASIDLYSIPAEDSLGKLETSLNVKELALMIRISFAAAVFVNRNLSQLVQLMAFRVSTVSTNVAKNISPKNLRNSLYTYDEATFNTVGNVLKRMMEKYNQIKALEIKRRKERS